MFAIRSAWRSIHHIPAHHLRQRRRRARTALCAVVVGSVLLAGPFHPMANAASVPGVPSGVTATATGSGTIHVAWKSVSNATSYVVSNGNMSTANLTSTGYNWGGLTPGTYMCFTVTAKNSAGQSAWSPYACTTTTVPTPANVTATSNNPDFFHITWSTIDSKAQYVVTNGNATNGPYQAGTGATDWGVGTPGTYMCFAVAAKEGNGQSPWSPYSCGISSVLAPTGVTAVPTSSGTIRVSWTDNTQGQGTFTVSNGNTSAPSDVAAGTTWYDWTGIAPNTYMCFTVAAKQNSGQSPWSPYACATTPSASADTYVNIGDSISAGEGTYNPYLVGTDTSTNKCHRSAKSYAAQYVASSSRYHAVKNAGAVNHMNIQSAGEPEQVSALSSATSLVTVTIGANNLNLGGIFTNCYSKLTFPAIDDCFTSSLSDDFINNTIPYVLEDTTDYGPSLDDTYTAIRNAAPNATIVVPTYAQVFPAVSPGDACGTIPQTMVSQANLTRIRRVVSAINNEVKAAAARHGFTVLDEENALAGHEECEPNSWVNPLNALGADDEDLHPTVAGYAKEAADIKAYLDAIA